MLWLVVGPSSAVNNTAFPGASASEYPPDHDTCVPSTRKPTPSVVPPGVKAEPWFNTIALNTTFVGAYNTPAGVQLIDVTTTSGNPFVGVALTCAEFVLSPNEFIADTR